MVPGGDSPLIDVGVAVVEAGEEGKVAGEFFPDGVAAGQGQLLPGEGASGGLILSAAEKNPKAAGNGGHR